MVAPSANGGVIAAGTEQSKRRDGCSRNVTEQTSTAGRDYVGCAGCDLCEDNDLVDFKCDLRGRSTPMERALETWDPTWGFARFRLGLLMLWVRAVDPDTRHRMHTCLRYLDAERAPFRPLGGTSSGARRTP